MRHKVSELRLVDSAKAFYSLNFHSIWQYFKTNNWKYAYTPKDRTPSIHELKDTVLGLLIDLERIVFDVGLPKEEDCTHSCSGGRFVVSIDDVGIIEISLNLTDSKFM